MIVSVDGLKMPAAISGSTELFNNDTQRRTASQRLITKLSPTEKWRVTVEYDTDMMTVEFQAAFYKKCAAMRTKSAAVTFISPYDGEVRTITAKCVSRSTPEAAYMYKQKPMLYRKVGAVFEEV